MNEIFKIFKIFNPEEIFRIKEDLRKEKLDELRQIHYHYLHSILKSHSFLPVGCNAILMKKNNLDFKITIKKNHEPFELFAFPLSISMFVFRVLFFICLFL